MQPCFWGYIRSSMSLFALRDVHKSWCYSMSVFGARCFHLAGALQTMQDDSDDLELLLPHGCCVIRSNTTMSAVPDFLKCFRKYSFKVSTQLSGKTKNSENCIQNRNQKNLLIICNRSCKCLLCGTGCIFTTWISNILQLESLITSKNPILYFCVVMKRFGVLFVSWFGCFFSFPDAHVSLTM